MKKSIQGAAAVLILLLLLSHPTLAYEGAKSGLLLWSQTVLPTLLPFMICSNVIVALDAIRFLTWPFQSILKNVLKLSPNGSYIFISGLLCGYPMGAKTCSEFLDDKRITGKEASYLLAICNHPSPMFLLGYVSGSLNGGISDWLLLASLYLPVFLLAVWARKIYRVGENEEKTENLERVRSMNRLNQISRGQSDHASRNQLEFASENRSNDTSGSRLDRSSGSQSDHAAGSFPVTPAKAALSFDRTMMGSVEVMVKIGGYIMLFSILAHYLEYLPLPGGPARALVLGFVEITTGIQALSVSTGGFLQGLAVVAVTAFGGLSGIFQTGSVISGNAKNAGLSIRHYVMWKCLHSALSCGCFILLLWLLPLIR